MSKTKDLLITWCQDKLGTPYVYGTKGEVLTQSKINVLASMYPATFTDAYIQKSKMFIGQNCTDCSGLISWLTGIVRGSSQYKATADAVYSLDELDESMIGYGLWKPGHIGIYVGGGYCIEAKGIDYGTVKTKVSASSWTHVLKLCDIDYSDETPERGWMQNSTGWWYVQEDGSYAAGWKKIENVWYYFNKDNGYMVSGDWVLDDGYWYYFNENGSLYYGWLLYKGRWLYLNQNGKPEGAAVTGFQRIEHEGQVNEYYFDEDGYMVTEEFVVIPDASGALNVMI